jgi:hypothetical protein
MNATAGAWEFAKMADFCSVSDEQLLGNTRRLVGRSNLVLASLLAHLAEVEARGVHRIRACSSLYTYCIYELRFSEDEALRRVSAARWVRQFPELFDAIASGELHLTGLLMLAPHLTVTNLHDVLARAKHRTKKELARLVRELDPLPPVPALIEPLGPVPRVSPRRAVRPRRRSLAIQPGPAVPGTQRARSRGRLRPRKDASRDRLGESPELRLAVAPGTSKQDQGVETTVRSAAGIETKPSR